MTNVCNSLDSDIWYRIEKEPYFVNFMRDAPEATGAEDQNLDVPHVYEYVSRTMEKLKLI